MPFMAAESSVPNRYIEDGDPKREGSRPNCQNLDPSSRYAMRIQPRHRGGEALRAVMAAWQEREKSEARMFVPNPRVETVLQA